MHSEPETQTGERPARAPRERSRRSRPSRSAGRDPRSHPEARRLRLGSGRRDLAPGGARALRVGPRRLAPGRATEPSLRSPLRPLPNGTATGPLPRPRSGSAGPKGAPPDGARSSSGNRRARRNRSSRRRTRTSRRSTTRASGVCGRVSLRTSARKKSRSACVSSRARSLRSSGDVVTLRFAKGCAFQREQVEDAANQKFLESATKKYFGRELRISCVGVDDGKETRRKPKDKTPPAGQASRPTAAGSRPTRSCRKIIDDFDGEIIRHHPQ